MEVGGSGLDGFEISSHLFRQIKQPATFVKKAFTSKQISDVPLIPTVFGFVGFTFYKLDQVPTEARLPCLFVVPCNPAQDVRTGGQDDIGFRPEILQEFRLNSTGVLPCPLDERPPVLR